jgi:hypothetical protein
MRNLFEKELRLTSSSEQENSVRIGTNVTGGKLERNII